MSGSVMSHSVVEPFTFDQKLISVIRSRAEQLKRERAGYLDAVNRITNELIEADEGKSNALTGAGLTAGWYSFDDPVIGGASGAAIGAGIGLVGGPIGAAVGAAIGLGLGALAGKERRDKRIEERRSAMRRTLRPRVQPIVSEVYG